MTSFEAERKGWKILAGPFDPSCPHEAALAARMLAFLKASGARVCEVSTGDLSGATAFNIWRRRREMETMDQTERRLATVRLREFPSH